MTPVATKTTLKQATTKSATVTRLPQTQRNAQQANRRLKALRLTPEERMNRLGPQTLDWLGTERLQQAADEYGAGYLLTVNSDELEFPVVYQNETYAVYALTPEKQGS